MTQVLPHFFTPIEGAKALMYSNGRYSEAPLYHRKHELYAKSGSSFIKLHPMGGGTSKPKTFWQDLSFETGSSKVEKGKLVWDFPTLQAA